MKAIFFTRHGGNEVLEYGERPDPVAGPGEVRVAIRAAAMNHLDIFVRDDYLAKIRRIEEIMREELLDMRAEVVRETRVFGACGVVEVHTPAAWHGLQDFASARGVWLRPFRDLVYTMPPYVTGDDDLAAIGDAVVAAAAIG